MSAKTEWFVELGGWCAEDSDIVKSMWEEIREEAKWFAEVEKLLADAESRKLL